MWRQGFHILFIPKASQHSEMTSIVMSAAAGRTNNVIALLSMERYSHVQGESEYFQGTASMD